MTNQEEVNKSLLPKPSESYPLAELTQSNNYHVVKLNEMPPAHTKPINLTWRNVCVQAPAVQPSCFKRRNENEKTPSPKIIIDHSKY